MEKENPILKTAVDITIKIGVLLLVIFFCFRILQPFVNILIWSLVISIIEYPAYYKLRDILGDRKKLAAIIVTVVLLSFILVPGYWLVNSLVEGMKSVVENFRSGDIQVPPPSESVSEWPLIGHWVYDKWIQASEGLSSFLKSYLPQMGTFGEKILISIKGTGLGILQFAVSIIMGGIFLIWSESFAESGKKFFIKLVGDRGEEFMMVAEQTIRNVATGVIGVAIIQTLLIGIALVITGVPFAGFWIVLILIIIIAQIPVILVSIPLIVYLFATHDLLPAILWTVYLIVVGLIDNILKPILMGKGSSIPMLVIFLGAIGGFIAYGFLGLFLGAIVISLGYTLYLSWINT